MIILGIRDKQTNYYLNLEKKGDNFSYYMVCSSNNGVFTLKKEEVSLLLNNVFNSKLSYLETNNGYDIYLDEALNKRFIKDGKEDFYKFFTYNGSDATLYDNSDNDNLDDNKRYILRNGTKIYEIYCLAALTSIFISSLLYSNCDTFHNLSYLESKIDYVIEGNITLEEMEEAILTSNNTNMDMEKKEKLINKDLFNDVLNISDSSRIYILRKKLKNVGIEYFSDITKKENPNLLGCYNIVDINTIYLKDDSEETFNLAAIHEFIHLLQDYNKYHYVKEACAEITNYEYYGNNVDTYLDQVKRIYKLMEIVGTKCVMDCCFKGDTSTFEDAITNNLGDEKGKRLLELFSTISSDFNSEVDSEIDQLLSIMYKNVYNDDIENDNLMKYIDYCFDAKTQYDRIYFNHNHDNYDNDFSINFIHTSKIDFDSVDKDSCCFYCYYKNNIDEENSDEYKVVYDNYDDFSKGNQSYFRCIVLFDDNKCGSLEFDEEKNCYVIECHTNIVDNFKSVAQKFDDKNVKK